jgi:hypothetical protein
MDPIFNKVVLLRQGRFGLGHYFRALLYSDRIDFCDKKTNEIKFTIPMNKISKVKGWSDSVIVEVEGQRYKLIFSSPWMRRTVFPGAYVGGQWRGAIKEYSQRQAQ